MLGNGFFIGIIFDGYRVLKYKIALPKIAILFIDICFGIISAFLTFYILIWSNNGQLRVIILLFFLTGMIIYYQTLSRYIVSYWLKFYNLIYSIYITLKKIIIFAIIKPLVYLYKILLMVISSIGMALFSLLVITKKASFYMAKVTINSFNKIQKKFQKK